MTVFDPDRRADPYGLYRELRDQHRVFWDEWLQTWVVLGHAEICALLTDRTLSSSRITGFYDRLPEQARQDLKPLADALRDMMVFTDAPRHGALRRLVRSGFTARYVREIRATVESIAEELAAGLVTGDVVDLVHDFATPLTTSTIATLTGVPATAAHLLADWQGLTHEFFVQSDAQVQRIRDLRALFDADMPARRAGVATDVFSRIIADEIRTGDYTDDEVFANFLLLIDAGLSTTTYLIGNAVRALLTNPVQESLLRREPSLLSNAVQELMRYDNSVQYTTRVATVDFDLAGNQVAAGQSITLVLGAGNRDPARYVDPDRLDLRRKAGDNVSFGHGGHYCLGATLAVTEIEVALAALLRHADEIIPADSEHEWLDSINFRFLKNLPVRLSAGVLSHR